MIGVVQTETTLWLNLYEIMNNQQRADLRGKNMAECCQDGLNLIPISKSEAQCKVCNTKHTLFS